MIVLALRTDKPEAEIYLYDGQNELAHVRWQAHLQLAETLNTKIEEILNKSSISYGDLKGLAIFKGPGSFTGLRIGVSVTNALAYAQGIPIVAIGGEDWINQSLQALRRGENHKVAVPEYGAPAHTTQPKK